MKFGMKAAGIAAATASGIPDCGPVSGAMAEDLSGRGCLPAAEGRGKMASGVTAISRARLCAAVVAVAMGLASANLLRAAVPAKQVQAVARSLVVVTYTAENEFKKSSKLSAQGIVLNSSGVVMVTADLFPLNLPLQYFHHLRIRIPTGRMPSVAAKYLGRSPDGVMCYVKALKPLDLPPLKIGKTTEVRLGEKVYSIGRLAKSLAYEPYVGIDHVKILSLQQRWIAATEFLGLTNATSPVYAMRTGAFAGITIPDDGGHLVELNILGHAAPVTISDPIQTGIFLPWDSVKSYLRQAPLHRMPWQAPWIGTMDSTGLKKAVRKLYHIKQMSGVMIGRVIPGMAAAKAGLKSQDIVLTINGKPFSHSPLPTYMLKAFERKLFACKPGTILHFGVLRDGTKHLTIAVKVGVQPLRGARMPRYLNRKLGLVVRDLSFFDRYNRKLSPHQKGVLVSLIRTGAPAGLGQTPLQPGYIITRINNKVVANGTAFTKLLHAAVHARHARSVVFEVLNANGDTAVCHVRLH